MEARFILLHADDPGEILMATALIRCLKTQVEESQVYSVVRDSNRWLLESNPWLDDLFVYRESVIELLDQLRDFLPDYLIDLHGGREVRRFKSRLKVLDFTLNRRKAGGNWSERAFETCTLFDVHDDGRGQELYTTAAYRDILPGNFLDGYLVLSLDKQGGERPVTDDQIIQIAVMTEKPIVVTGNVQDRNLADRIGQSAGCAVFPTCGDLSPSETASVLSHAMGAVLFDSLWSGITGALGIRSTVILEKMGPEDLQNTAIWARSLFPKSHGRTTV